MDATRRSPHPPLQFRSPTSIAVWGLRRPLVTRVAIALAEAVGGETFWFEIAAPDAPLDPEELAVLERLDPERAFWVAPGDIAPDEPRGTPEHWTVLSDLAGDPESPALLNLMKMPPRLRSLLLDRDPSAPTAAVVLSNTDRAAQYYSAEPGTLTEAIRVMNRLGLTFIATTGRVPRPNVRDLEFVFEVAADPGEEGGTVVTHRGDASLGPLFADGARTPLPAFLDALRPGPHRSSQGAA
jgi:hypothetical protein